MGLKTETRKIAGLDVRSTQLPALASFNLLTKLGRIVAPVLKEIDIDALNMDDDISVLAGPLAALFAALDPDDSGPLLREILSQTAVTMDDSDGLRLEELTSGDAINRVFAGRLKMMFEVVVFALKVNFSDFFDGAPDLESSAEPENKSESPSISQKQSGKRGRRGASG